MKNVFENTGTEANVESEIETLKKPKRSAFVFITTESESSGLALEDLKKVEGVIEVYLAHGAYDLVAKVTGESFDNLRQIVQSQIRNLSRIKSTLTLTVI